MIEFKDYLPKLDLGQTFRSLRNPKYRIYSGGQFVSMAGTWMQGVALSWVIYKMTGSPLALGLVQFASNLPLLLFMYFGGLIADRFDKRRILIATQWLDMAQALVLTALVITGYLSVPLLIGLSVFLGCVTAVEIPCRQAFVGELVNKDELGSAIGMNSAITNLSRLIGPVMAGFFMSSGGEALCFAVNALSYLATIWAFKKLGDMKSVEQPGSADLAGAANAVEQSGEQASDTTIGAWLKQPHIRNVILLVAITSLFGFQFQVLLPVISAQNLHDSTGAQLALLSAAMGIGALLGSLLIATKGTVEWLRRKVAFAALILSAGIVGLAFSQSLALCMLSMGACGFAVAVQLGGSNSLMQLQVPTKLRGRAMSIFSTMMMGLGPFASLLAGYTAEHLGLAITLSISSAVMVAASFTYLRGTKRGAKSNEEKNEESK